MHHIFSQKVVLVFFFLGNPTVRWWWSNNGDWTGPLEILVSNVRHVLKLQDVKNSWLCLGRQSKHSWCHPVQKSSESIIFHFVCKIFSPLMNKNFHLGESIMIRSSSPWTRYQHWVVVVYGTHCFPSAVFLKSRVNRSYSTLIQMVQRDRHSCPYNFGYVRGIMYVGCMYVVCNHTPGPITKTLNSGSCWYLIKDFIDSL
jgi:hypothetical protein